jgi:predicted SprT family Zn-dependent metalloprotease
MPSTYDTDNHKYNYTCDFCNGKIATDEKGYTNTRWYNGISMYTCDRCDTLLRLLHDAQAAYAAYNDATEKLRVATGN